jgi:hypothetical protein
MVGLRPDSGIQDGSQGHTVRVTTVLLAFHDGRPKELVEGAHIHGFADGELLLATGLPGEGLDAEVTRRVPVSELSRAETCPPAEADVGDEKDSATWTLGWDDSSSP